METALKMLKLLFYEPFGHGLFMCFSILGLWNSPFFYVMCLLEYFSMPGGRNVLMALYVGGPNLARSFMVGEP